jgi:hypothetical protein
MPILGSRHVTGRDARLIVSGLALVAGAAVLAFTSASHESALLALAVGAGLCASAPAVVRSPRLSVTLLIALLTGFIACRFGVLVADSAVSAGHVLRLLTEGLIVGVVYELAYSHAHGLAQIAALFRGRDAGYALVLDEGSAARNIDAQLARSRRHGTPATLLLLEPTNGSAGPAFEAVMRGVSSSAIAELERIYVQQRSCRLISQQVRRSDVVGCSSAQRFLVLSTDTGAAGTAVLANRVVDSIRAELGIELAPGIAEFPVDGSTYGDLIAVATSGASGHTATPRDVQAGVTTVDFDASARRRVEANP